jgi:hypothetical protein
MEIVIAIPYQLHFFRSVQRSMDADILNLIGITSVSGNKYLTALQKAQETELMPVAFRPT